MKINICSEQPFDYEQCEALVRDAFWDVYRPGCVEHLIVHQLRTAPELVLDVVAETETETETESLPAAELLGCLIATRAQVVGQSGATQEVLYLGPLAVHPDCQRRGVGSQLVSFALGWAEQAGFAGAFLYGNPDY